MGTSVVKRQVWIEHVQSWQDSGQTQRGYCEAHGLSYHAFDYWRRFVLKRPAPGGFLPVRAPTPGKAGAAIEVRLAGGASVVWPGQRPLEELAQLLRALALA